MKRFLIFVLCIFLFAGCGTADKTNSISAESLVEETSSTTAETSFEEMISTPEKTAKITIDHAENTLYDEVSYSEEGANYDLIFFTNVAVKNFTLLETDESETLKVVGPLWCIDELTPEKPVIVSTWLNDATISRGISYTDQNGKEHVFSIVLSMKDESVSLVDFKEQTTKDESTPSDEPKEQKTLTIDEAFEAYLKGEIPAIYKNGEDMYVYDHYRIMDGKTGIHSYAFCDVTGDDIPELLVASVGIEILMYQDGKLVTIYESASNFMNGPIYLLENKAMFVKHSTTGTFYYYTTFNADGTSKETEFGLLENPEDETQNEYWFGEYDKKVIKEEFDKLTKDIFAAAEKEAKLDWIEWTPPLNWEELQGY